MILEDDLANFLNYPFMSSLVIRNILLSLDIYEQFSFCHLYKYERYSKKNYTFCCAKIGYNVECMKNSEITQKNVTLKDQPDPGILL